MEFYENSEICSERVSKDGTKRGSNKNSLSNLKPFKKGTSGNPFGKMKGVRNYRTLVDLAIDSLAEKYVNQYNKTNKDKKLNLEEVDIEQDIFVQLINKARNGDLKAMEIFFDHRYGKPRMMPQDSYTSYEDLEEKELKNKEAKKKAREMLDKWESGWFKK